MSTTFKTAQGLITQDASFNKEYFQFLIDDCALTRMEASIVANNLIEFREDLVSGKLFIVVKDDHKAYTRDQLLEYYFIYSLIVGNPQIAQLLLFEIHTAIPENILLGAIFEESSFERDKDAKTIIELYLLLLKEHKISENNPLACELALSKAKEGNFRVAEAMIQLKLLNSTNATDSDGHTLLYYRLINNTSKSTLTPQELIQLGLKLSEKDRVALDNFQFIENISQAIQIGDELLLNSLLEQLRSKLNDLTPDQIEKLTFKALATNSTSLLKLLLPKCEEKKYPIMLLNAQYLETASMLIDFMAEHNLPNEQRGSLPEFAHRLGLNGYPASDIDSNEFLFHSLNDISGSQETGSPYNIVMKALHRTVLLNYLQPPNLIKSLFHKFHAEGKLNLLTIGWSQHGVGLATLWDEQSQTSYVIFANRGQGTLAACINQSELKKKYKDKFGLVIYKFSGKLSPEFFNGFEIGEKKGGFFRYSQSAFEKELGVKLEDAQIILPCILAASQKYGTCGYVNTKLAIEGVLCVLEMLKGTKLSDNLINKITLDYKLMSNEDKNLACDQLITAFTLAQSLELGPKIQALRVFIINVLITHSINTTTENIARMTSLYKALPESDQTKLMNLLPQHIVSKVAEQKLTTHSALSIFESIRVPAVALAQPFKLHSNSIDWLLNHSEKIKALLDYLTDSGYTSEDITLISFKENSIQLTTRMDRDFKYKLKDHLANRLGISIHNLSGEFAFILEDTEAVFLAIQTNHLNFKAPKAFS